MPDRPSLDALREAAKHVRELCDCPDCAAACAYIAALEAEVERNRQCEPCRNDDHDDCTGACTSMCCALAFSEAEVERLMPSTTEEGT